MAKQSKSERERNRKRKEKSEALSTQKAVADSLAMFPSAYLAARVGIAGRPLMGPITWGLIIAGAGTAGKFLLDDGPVVSGITTGMQAVGVADAALLGAQHRLAAGQAGA